MYLQFRPKPAISALPPSGHPQYPGTHSPRGLLELYESGALTGARTDKAQAELLTRAHHARNRLLADEVDLADRYVRRLGLLAFSLSAITTAIVEGRQPYGLSASVIFRMPGIPFEWNAQERELGLG
jgi:hypothetical protein